MCECGVCTVAAPPVGGVGGPPGAVTPGCPREGAPTGWSQGFAVRDPVLTGRVKAEEGG